MVDHWKSVIPNKNRNPLEDDEEITGREEMASNQTSKFIDTSLFYIKKAAFKSNNLKMARVYSDTFKKNKIDQILSRLQYIRLLLLF